MTPAARFFLALGSTVFLFLFSLVTIGTLGFALGFSLSPVQFFLALAATAAGSCFLVRGWFSGATGAAWRWGFLAFAVLLGLFLVVGNAFFDRSWDGQAYQQEAVIQLAQGWNPLINPDFGEPTAHHLQLLYWPKAPWIAEALLYSVTGRLESAKAVNFLLIAGTFCLVVFLCLELRLFPAPAAVGLAFLIAWNPVSVCQSLSFYVDGQVASLFSALAVAATLVVRSRRWPAYALLAAVLTLMVNTKFNGAVFAVILLAGAGAYPLVRARDFRGVFRLSLATGSMALIAFFGVGYNPYVNNVLRGGHPFFPLAGPNAYYFTAFAEADRPADFAGANRFVKLARSLGAVSDNAVAPQVSRPKWPFLVFADELDAFGEVGEDVRVGGWGPLFGGGIILTGLGAGLVLLFHFRTGLALLALEAVLLASVFVNPESWRARFSPQCWLIPCLVAGCALLLSRPARWFGRVLTLVLAANIALLTCFYFAGNWDCTEAIARQLSALKRSGRSVVVCFGWFRGNRVRFQEAGLPFREVQSVEALPCGNPGKLHHSQGQFCLEGRVRAK